MIVDIHTRIWNSISVLGRGAELLHRRRTQPWQRPDASPSSHAAAMQPVQTAIVHGYESKRFEASIAFETVADYVRTNPGRRLGFAGIDPTVGRPAKRVEEATSLGLVGVTVNPAVQGFHPADSRAMPLYEACEAKGLPVFFDSAQMLARGAQLEFAQPYLLDEVARSFPDLKLVICGLGQPWIEQGLALIGKHPTVFTDLAELILHPWRVYNALLPAYQHGVMGQILFGSNFPFCTPEKAIVTIYSVNTFTQGTHLPSVPREQLRSIVERDALKCLGLPRPASSTPEHSPQPSNGKTAAPPTTSPPSASKSSMSAEAQPDDQRPDPSRGASAVVEPEPER